jgi:hypothetical protein
MKMLSLVLLPFALAGCAARIVTIAEPFDAEQAQAMLAPGANTITGSALIRQEGGGIVTCAGNEVFLIPATEYAKNRFQAIYGVGKVVSVNRQKIEFPGAPSAYLSTMRTTRCNAQGFFKFDNLRDGEFFVQTSVIWKAGTYMTIMQGGGLLERVVLRGGQTTDITMAP